MGIAHPDFLFEMLTSSQWQDWIDWASVEPIGDERDDWRIGSTMARLASYWGEAKAEDFVPDWLASKSTLSPEQKMEFLAMAHNAKLAAAEEARRGAKSG